MTASDEVSLGSKEDRDMDCVLLSDSVFDAWKSCGLKGLQMLSVMVPGAVLGGAISPHLG